MADVKNFIEAVLTPTEDGWTTEDQACWEAGLEKRAEELEEYKTAKKLHKKAGKEIKRAQNAQAYFESRYPELGARPTILDLWARQWRRDS